ncbi:MAG TPA: permease [Terriglobia bacterium]|nr:permease [Terriglobia bacterium]
MFKRNTLVVVYDGLQGAAEAVTSLLRSEFDMRKVSVVGKDLHTEEQVVGYYRVGDQMKCWSETGNSWGNIWKVLAGWAFFVIPGLGSILVAGPLEGWILQGLQDAAVVGGLSALGAALYGMEIPKENVRGYESAVKDDKILLIVYGVDGEVARAGDIIKTTPAIDSSVYAG